MDTPLLQVLGAWRSDAWKGYVRWADDRLLEAGARVWAAADDRPRRNTPAPIAVAAPAPIAVAAGDVLTAAAWSAEPQQSDATTLVADISSDLFAAEEDTVVVSLQPRPSQPQQSNKRSRTALSYRATHR